MKNLIFNLLIGISLGCFISSCEETTIVDTSLIEKEVTPIVTYAFAVDGLKASFNNYSGYFEEYNWDFGDGATSDQINPSHIFTDKGVYEVTLTGKSEDTEDVFSDFITIDGPTINIDGKFDDWQYVSYDDQSEEGTLSGVKTYTSASHIFFYLEGTVEMKLDPFQIFFDTDNDPSTGYSAEDMYPGGSGFDYMYQGMYDYWGDFSIKAGEPTEWNFEFVSNYETFFDSYSIQTVEDKVIIEFSIEKSNFSGLKSTLNYGIRELNSSWGEAGSLPKIGAANSKMIPIKLAE